MDPCTPPYTQGCGGHASGLMHLRDTTSGSLPLNARARRSALYQAGRGIGAEETTCCHGSAVMEDSLTSLRFPAPPRAGEPGGTVQTRVTAADGVKSQQRTLPGSRNMDGAGFVRAASQADDDPSPCTPTKPCPVASTPRSADGMSTWSDGVTPVSPAMTATASSMTTTEQVRCKLV